MKRAFIILLILIFMTGCGRKFLVVVKDDPFKKATTVTADMWHTVSDGNLDNMRALYTKDIKNGIASNPELKLEFSGLLGTYTGYQGEQLEKEAYISTDTKSFKVFLDDLTQKEFKDTRSSSDSSLDSSGFRSSSSTRTWHTAHMTGTIILTPDIQKAIIDSKSYMIRVYAGKTPTTLTATPAQLEALKKFLQFDATNTKK
ncbi:MAG: hypothetical protein A2176_08990 [Spirochaetes bacterium RBG_13_51_14]|nr:MAG: hypothetical protein A2176_08990 [Spirochaetes bacterium RBG_13_51_14]